ncbi:hypothetical protein CRG98_026121 [Punica granatum]|uniref:Ion transport domain-containing protein n=1 Tax=Punica granatum TaxID=22663 RepID=A0A2I0JAZ0_PUNGR|nr:hypothetical protein CRG98_026121 [Punica granatum]
MSKSPPATSIREGMADGDAPIPQILGILAVEGTLLLRLSMISLAPSLEDSQCLFRHSPSVSVYSLRRYGHCICSIRWSELKPNRHLVAERWLTAKVKEQSSADYEDPQIQCRKEDAEGRAKRFKSYIFSCVPCVMNPHAKVVQLRSKFFVISCLVAVVVDPLFFFLLGVQLDNKCIVLNGTMTTTIVVFRCVTDFMYILHILLQFRLAYIAPESRVVGAGDLVGNPRKSPSITCKGMYRPTGEDLQQLQSKSHGDIGRNVKLATPILGPYTLASKTHELLSSENLRYAIIPGF